MFYVVRGLSPYTEYEFYVIAMNNIGRGPPSAPATTTTGETGKNNRIHPCRLIEMADLLSVPNSGVREKLRTEIEFFSSNVNFILSISFFLRFTMSVHMNERKMAFLLSPQHHKTFMQTKSMSETGYCR